MALDIDNAGLYVKGSFKCLECGRWVGATYDHAINCMSYQAMKYFATTDATGTVPTITLEGMPFEEFDSAGNKIDPMPPSDFFAGDPYYKPTADQRIDIAELTEVIRVLTRATEALSEKIKEATKAVNELTVLYEKLKDDD